MLFNKICIIGVGLIGGSLGKCIKHKKIAELVYGVVRREETILRAKELNAIDEGSLNLEAGVEDADLVIICTPISQIVAFVEKCLKYINNKETIITDIGSTKYEILIQVKKLISSSRRKPSTIHFIGGHPIAGSEKNGVEYANGNLFRNKYYVLTPLPNTNHAALNKLQEFVKKLEAIPIILDAKTHDYIFGLTSHLPHMVAYALVNTVLNEKVKFFAPSFYDITRVTKSNPKMIFDIIKSNKKNILKFLKLYKYNLNQLAALIKSNNDEKLCNYLKRIKVDREKIEGSVK